MTTFFSYAVDERVKLVKPDITMASEMYQLICSNQAHLGSFLPIPERVQSVADEVTFILDTMKKEGAGTNRQFFIALDEQLVGAIDIHQIRIPQKSGEVGYWLAAAFTNQGIVTKSLSVLCQLAFEEWDFNKLELIAAVTNKASNQVAQKCDFQLIGRLPDEIFHQDVLKDANLWCLTKADYHKLHVL